jgi:predicted 2-oxoglutarate/Fe(II)-dependent dioxygenase YbiX
MSRTLEPGDRFPDFVLSRSDGPPTRLYSRVGGDPVLLVVARKLHDLPDEMARLSRVCDVVCVAPDPQVASAICFRDPDGDVIDTYVADGATITSYVLNPNLRVVAVFTDDPPIDDIERALVEQTWSDSSKVIGRQAPVLLVDNVLDPDRCAFLMQMWERAGSVETGVEQSAGEERKEMLVATQKSRRDHTVEDPKLTRLLTQSIGRKLLPEIERSFIYQPSHFEGFKIACYDAESAGFFHAHRDNLSPATAHRRLAVSLILNDGYDGGELRFPEFGPDRYSAPAGSAVVFSCAHLHEVLPVTAGRRFTLLTFLYDETAQRQDAIDPFDL